MQSTNVVHAILPIDPDIAIARVLMGHFGEVYSIRLVPGSDSVFAVTYFDIRAAVHALQVLGAAHCWPSAPSGDRTVRLLGTAKLDDDVIPKISGMHADASERESYIV